MPQASEELRAKWGICEQKAMKHLEGKVDPKLLRRGLIHWNDGYAPKEEDESAAQFLVDEWDFGEL